MGEGERWRQINRRISISYLHFSAVMERSWEKNSNSLQLRRFVYHFHLKSRLVNQFFVSATIELISDESPFVCRLRSNCFSFVRVDGSVLDEWREGKVYVRLRRLRILGFMRWHFYVNSARIEEERRKDTC